MSRIKESLGRLLETTAAPDKTLAVALRSLADSVDFYLKAGEIIEQTGLRGTCERLIQEKGWRLSELPMVDRHSGLEIGQFLALKSQPGGNGMDYYYGDLALVGVNGRDSEITIQGHYVYREFRHNKRGPAWSLRQIESSISLALHSPGSYVWMEGMGYEKHEF